MKRRQDSDNGAPSNEPDSKKPTVTEPPPAPPAEKISTEVTPIDSVVSKHNIGIEIKSQESFLIFPLTGSDLAKCWELFESVLLFGYFKIMGDLLKDVPVYVFCESFRDKPDEVPH